MKNCCACLCRLSQKMFGFSDRFLWPLWLLIIRYVMAKIFFLSGLTKYESFESAVQLFTYEYHVPVLSPLWAAYLSTAGELFLPVLLILGLGGRFAALGMLFMVGMIEISYQHFDVHIFWALLLGVIVLHGPGRFSLDALLMRCMYKQGAVT